MKRVGLFISYVFYIVIGGILLAIDISVMFFNNKGIDCFDRFYDLGIYFEK